jgi:hypothetical protein
MRKSTSYVSLPVKLSTLTYCDLGFELRISLNFIAPLPWIITTHLQNPVQPSFLGVLLLWKWLNANFVLNPGGVGKA